MSVEIVLQQMMIIFILILTGYTACKKHIISADISRGISALVVNICNPAILIRSAFTRDASLTNEKLLLAILAGGIVYAMMLAAARILPALLKIEEKWKAHYGMMCLFNNVGFIGIPLASAVLGTEALIYVAIINVYFNLFFYTYGIRLADRDGGRIEWKSFLNAGNISIVIMVIIFMWQPAVPAVISSSIDYMANTTTFLAMVVIGISLAKTDLKQIFMQKKMYLFIALRFLGLPILIGLVLKMFVHDEILYGTMVLMSAMPVANLPLMRVEETGGDGTVLSQAIILSTILSLVTVPAVVAFV